jgi:hypothetical protein
MKLSDIKARQDIVFQPVDPLYEEPIEDVRIVFYPRSEKGKYETFSEAVSAKGLDDPELIAKAFFGVFKEGSFGEYDFTEEGFIALLTSPDSSFIAQQLLDFFTDRSNFFTVNRGKPKTTRK